MRKNQFAAFLFIVSVIFICGTYSGYADDAADTMEAALKSQDAESAQTVSTAPEVSTPAAPVVPEDVSDSPAAAPASDVSAPVKARDVLTSEEKISESPAQGGDSENGDEETVVPDKAAALDDAAKAGKILIADFDSGDKPNNLGGDYGAWDKDPNDDSQTCRATHASDDALSNMEGFALRLDYDVDSSNPAYNGFWMKLENLNATPYDTLSFYVRGASHRFTKRLKVELKTPDSRSSSFIVSGISEQWQKIEVPLRRFKGIKDWTILSEMILVFDDINTAPKKGTLLVDQIMLERHENGMEIKADSKEDSHYVVSDNAKPAEIVSPG